MEDKYTRNQDRGKLMKGTRLKDVLDDKPLDKTKWDIIFGKLKKLGTAIEMYYGPHMDIDNVEYRWVQDRIEYWESEERLLTKEEMNIANFYWKKYGK